jgi:hypothetical protein
MKRLKHDVAIQKLPWHKRLKRYRPGDRPEGVFIVNKATGEKLPCELSYVGIDEKGMHEWQISTAFDPKFERVSIAVFPPLTSLSFPMLVREDGEE